MPVAEAVAYGAASVVNAISTGKGAALGVDLWTRAEVKLTQNAGNVTANIRSEPGEATDLVTAVVRKVLERYGRSRRFGAHVETRSNIPIARGMKSSSAAANAVALATTAALGEKIRDREVLEDSVEGALEAGVTVTGAFDDASASYYGGLVVTDNKRRRILRRERVPNYCVLFHIPPRKSYTAKANILEFRKLAQIAELAHGLALGRHYWEALTLNGLAHSVVLGWEPKVAIAAMSGGAVAAGLSGKGPATVAIVKKHRASDVRRAMSMFEGRIVEARINNRKARVIASDS